MSLDINLTGVEITSNKKTTLTDNSDTFYPTQKAVKTAVDAKQNTLGFTPENVANLSTDVNTDQASNSKYPSVKAVFDWAVGLFVQKNSAITGATKTKITYDAKGLVTAGADATTADIADSSNKRYVTDANLTVIGNTSGTNSGDETQSSILSKLGWWQYNRITETAAITNTIIEAIIENIQIPANTYLNGGILRLYNLKVRKVGAVGATTSMKIYIGPNSSNLSGATLIATYSSLASNILTIEMLRTFTATTTGLLGFGAGSSSPVDTGTGATARTSTTVDWTVNQYIIITIQAASLTDSYSMIGASAKNF